MKFLLNTAQADLLKLNLASNAQGFSEGIALDFEGIAAVNASYVRASVAWLIRCGMMHHADVSQFHLNAEDPWSIRPIEIGGVLVANVAAEIREEIESVLNQPSVRLVCLEATNFKYGDAVKRVQVLGHLDVQLEQCLRKLYAHGGTATTAELHARYQDEGVQITAWNNRLAGLYERFLLRRKKLGRNFIYQTLSKEIEHNGILLSAA